MKKIEFSCTKCKSLLRLPAAFVGRKARCPVCGNVDVVTSGTESPADEFSGEEFLENEIPKEQFSSSHLGRKYEPNDFSGPVNDMQSPFAPPQAQSPFQSTNSGAAGAANDGLWVASLTLGIISIVFSVIGGCCCGGVVSVPVGVTGLILSINSSSQSKNVCLILNCIGIGLGLIGVVVQLAFIAMR